MKKTVIIALSLCLMACSVSSTKDEPVIQKTSTAIPEIETLVGAKYYSELNLLVDSATNRLFYHIYNSKGIRCVTGLDLNFPLPINLTPKKLKEVNTEYLEVIIEANKQDSFYVFVVCKDTLNKSCKELIAMIRKQTHLKPVVRKPTEEEAVVLNYKIHKKNYDKEAIDWVNPNFKGYFKPRRKTGFK